METPTEEEYLLSYLLTLLVVCLFLGSPGRNKKLLWGEEEKPLDGWFFLWWINLRFAILKPKNR